MAANTEMIDALVSDSALKSLDALNVKLTSSYAEMEKILVQVQKLNTSYESLGKNFNEVSKFASEQEKATKAATKATQDATEAEQERKKVIDEVIHSEKEQTKVTKELEQTTKQLLAAAERTAKGIDISAYVQENEKGMKNYSNAINAVSQQLGIIDGLQAVLNERLKQGAISEEEYGNAMSGLSQRQSEYEQSLISLQANYEKTGEAQRSVFDPASANAAFSNLSPQIQQQALSLVEMNVELNAVRESQKELDKSYKDGEITLDAYIQKKAQLNALEADQSNAVRDLSKELQLNQQIANTSVGSYDNLSARYSLMKIEINALGEAEGQNAEQKRVLEKEAKALYEQMNELQKATGKAQLQVGDYTLINKELEGALNQVNPALGGTVAGIQSATKAAMTFIATPIGLVLAAIAAALALVTTWFNRTEEGQNALAVASAAFEQVLSAVLNVASELGAIIFKLFTDPKEAIVELGDMIVENILNRLEAFGKMGEAIVKILKGDLIDGFKDLGNATVQLATGIEDVGGKWDDIVEKAQKAAEIQKELNDLATEERELGVEKAKTLSEQNRLRNIANNQEASLAERMDANNKYIELTNKLEEKTIGHLKEQVRLEEAKLILQKGSYDALSIEEKQKLADLQKKIYETEAAAEQKLFTATRTNNRLRKEGANAAKKAADDAAKAEKERIREHNKEVKALGELESFNFRKSANLQQQIFKDATLAYDERKTALRAYIDDEISIIKTKEKEEIRQEGLTETQKKLIREKALYEIFKLEQKHEEELKNLKMKEAETEVKRIQGIISQRSEELNKEMQDELVFTANNYEKKIEQNINNEKKRTELTEEYQKLRLEIIRKYNQVAFDFEVEQLSKSLDNTELTEEQKLNIQKKIDELRKKNAKDMAEFEIQQTEGKVDKMLTAEESFNKIMSDARVKSLQAMWGIALDMAAMYYDEQLKQIDALEKREQEYWENKIEMIDENVEAGLMSEEEADARKRIIEETQMEREKQYEQQRKEIQRKQAIWNKANTMVQTAIAGANAIVVAMGAPFPLNLALPAVIGGMVAAQLAMIAAQSIPAYAKGTDYHPGGLARVGDGGRSEMVILPTGEVWKTPDTDTFVHLPRGTEVLPDYKKAMMNMSSQPYMSYYDDDSGKMIFLNDEVLRNNTKEANNQLSSINRGINAIRYNNIYSNRKNNTGYRFRNNLFN